MTEGTCRLSARARTGETDLICVYATHLFILLCPFCDKQDERGIRVLCCIEYCEIEYIHIRPFKWGEVRVDLSQAMPRVSIRIFVYRHFSATSGKIVIGQLYDGGRIGCTLETTALPLVAVNFLMCLQPDSNPICVEGQRVVNGLI